jgi:hypothetical protein
MPGAACRAQFAVHKQQLESGCCAMLPSRRGCNWPVATLCMCLAEVTQANRRFVQPASLAADKAVHTTHCMDVSRYFLQAASCIAEMFDLQAVARRSDKGNRNV